MGGFVVDGMVSGLDTSNLIKQLIEAERAPQRKMESAKSSLQTTIKAFTELNNKFKAIKDAAEKLSAPADWDQHTATTSDKAVATATVTGTPTPGSLTFTVTQLAEAHTVVASTGVADTDTTVVATGDFTIGGTTFTAAEYGGGTLAEVANAINDSDAGVSATIVKVADGDHRLQLTSKSTGTANAVVVGGGNLAALGTFNTITAAADATIEVGDPLAGGYSISSSTNTFADVLPGMSFTAVSEGTATISVSRDAEGLADTVQKLVDAVNGVQKFITEQSKYDTASKRGGEFLGESLPSRLFTQLQNQIIDPIAGATVHAADLGLELARDGTVAFDKAKFLAAYADDPAAVEAHFGKNVLEDTADDGLAERLSRMATDATRLNTGAISSHIAGQERRVEMYDELIERWDLRLEARETTLRRQFTAMETSLSRMQQQSSWLASQLSGLSANWQT